METKLFSCILSYPNFKIMTMPIFDSHKFWPSTPKIIWIKIFLVCEMVFLFIYEPFWSKIKILFSLSYEDKFWEKMMETQMPPQPRPL